MTCASSIRRLPPHNRISAIQRSRQTLPSKKNPKTNHLEDPLCLRAIQAVSLCVDKMTLRRSSMQWWHAVLAVVLPMSLNTKKILPCSSDQTEMISCESKMVGVHCTRTSTEFIPIWGHRIWIWVQVRVQYIPSYGHRSCQKRNGLDYRKNAKTAGTDQNMKR